MIHRDRNGDRLQKSEDQESFAAKVREARKEKTIHLVAARNDIAESIYGSIAKYSINENDLKTIIDQIYKELGI